MEFVIGVLALLFVVFVTLGVIAAVRAVRAVKRGVERTGAQVRRTVEETALKAKTAQPGPVGEVARVRLELRSSIDSTRLALETGAGDDASLREAIGLLDRLHDHARQVDGELRLLMEREPDRARIAERLPDVRKRVDTIKESADSLRFAAQDRAGQYDAEGLSALREQIEIESGALRGWREPPAGGAPALDAERTPDGEAARRLRGPDAAEALERGTGEALERGTGEALERGTGEAGASGTSGASEAGAAPETDTGTDAGADVDTEAGAGAAGKQPRKLPDLRKGRPQSAP
ncbi:hypothetical protein [Streptomyces armeniacus]|uniref:hypothetical protein n=1 Tax=Streptomyces armeniacus TaxID=83291 RepID=UPI001AD810CC|nr:hypothetical protein [Streptomyces armeniacus]